MMIAVNPFGVSLDAGSRHAAHAAAVAAAADTSADRGFP